MAFITEDVGAVAFVGALVLLLIGFAFGYRMGREQSPPGTDRGRLDQAPSMPIAPATAAASAQSFGPAPSNVSPQALTRIHDALRAGNKIQAIKIMREETHMGLAEAKTAVEAMQR